jgi:thioredoxin-like negative regulator of GroEL
MAAEDWDGAIELLSRIPDYRDSRSLTLQCHYRKAAALEEAGDLEGAASEFLMAGEWGDAAERTAGITLKQADALFEAGDLRGAHALYASLPDNEECAEKDRICRVSLAKDAVNSLEYTLALELLEGVPDSYENAGTLRTEASYQKAKAAVKQEDFETAVSLLQPLDRQALRKKYKDIETLYLTACEGAGVEAYPATPDPEAENTPEITNTPAPDDKTEAEESDPPAFLVTEDEPS